MKYSLTLIFVLAACGCERTSPPVEVTSSDVKALPSLPEMEKGDGKLQKLALDLPDVGNVKCALLASPEYQSSEPAALVVMLHYGYQGARPEPFTGADFLEVFGRSMMRRSAIVIAPDVMSGDWTDSINERAVLQLVEMAKRDFNIDESKVILAGYSMGGEGTWYIGSRNQDVFTGAIPIAAPVAGSTEWSIPVRAIHGPADQVVSFDAGRRHADAIKAAGGDVTFTSAVGCTHYDMMRYGPYFDAALTDLIDSTPPM